MNERLEETLLIFHENIKVIKKEFNVDYDYEKIESYLSVFDDIPINDRKSIISNLVTVIWGYYDQKKRGVQKKDIEDLRNKVFKYQEALRELHNLDVVDEVKFRNGDVYSYNGEYDFEDDFEIDLHLYHLPKPLQENYLTNIKLLKEIEYFKNLLVFYNNEGLSDQIKKEDFLSEMEFKLLNPSDFIGIYRPSKEYLKQMLYSYADKFKLRKYEVKQLIDNI